RRKRRKLVAPPLADGARQIRITETGEVLKRRKRSVFFAHEQQGNMRCQQLQRDCGAQGFRLLVAQGGQPLAQSAVAGLIMILQEEDERVWRQALAGLATWLTAARRAGLPLIDKALCQALG